MIKFKDLATGNKFIVCEDGLKGNKLMRNHLYVKLSESALLCFCNGEMVNLEKTENDFTVVNIVM